MAEPARRQSSAPDIPEYDPTAIQRRLAHERARREARLDARRVRRNAALRFLVTIVVLLGFTVAVSLVIWHEIRRLFGI